MRLSRILQSLAYGFRLMTQFYCCSASYVDASSKAIVTLTTYGSRVRHSYLAITSIGMGMEKPRKILLNLAEDDYRQNAKLVTKLEKRGVRVTVGENFGPHSKWYPTASTLKPADDSCAIVLIDDDRLFSKTFLTELVRAWSGRPDEVVAYQTETELLESSTDTITIPLGVGGVLYPAPLIRRVAEEGTIFKQIAPMQDDIYLAFAIHNLSSNVRAIKGSQRDFDAYWIQYQNPLMRRNLKGRENECALRKCREYFAQKS